MTSPILLRSEMTVRAVLRRRLTLGLLIAMPIAFYFVTNDSVGRSVRSLIFGLSWAVSTVAFFAAISARDLEPRLVLAGGSPSRLLVGRLLGLLALGVALTGGFGVLVALDQDVRSLGGVLLGFAVTSVVAVALGTAVGALVSREMEGTLILFFVAGLQAIVNPFDTYSRALPFWSSRELGTYAVDGPAQGSLSEGMIHAAIVIVACAVVLAFTARRGVRRS